jgi:hypothetical protein
MILMNYEAYRPEFSYGILEEGTQDLNAVRHRVHSRVIEANDPSEFGDEFEFGPTVDMIGVLSSLAIQNGTVCAEWATDRGGHNAIVQSLTGDMDNTEVTLKQSVPDNETTLEIGAFCVITGWAPQLFIGTFNQSSQARSEKVALSEEAQSALRALTLGTAEEMRRLDGRKQYKIDIAYDFGDPDIQVEEGRLHISNPYGY